MFFVHWKKIYQIFINIYSIKKMILKSNWFLFQINIYLHLYIYIYLFIYLFIYLVFRQTFIKI